MPQGPAFQGHTAVGGCHSCHGRQEHSSKADGARRLASAAHVDVAAGKPRGGQPAAAVCAHECWCGWCDVRPPAPPAAEAKPKLGAGWMQNAARKSSRQLFGYVVFCVSYAAHVMLSHRMGQHASGANVDVPSIARAPSTRAADAVPVPAAHTDIPAVATTHEAPPLQDAAPPEPSARLETVKPLPRAATKPTRRRTKPSSVQPSSTSATTRPTRRTKSSAGDDPAQEPASVQAALHNGTRRSHRLACKASRAAQALPPVEAAAAAPKARRPAKRRRAADVDDVAHADVAARDVGDVADVADEAQPPAEPDMPPATSPAPAPQQPHHEPVAATPLLTSPGALPNVPGAQLLDTLSGPRKPACTGTRRLTECFEVEGSMQLLQELFGPTGMSPHAALIVDEAGGGV